MENFWGSDVWGTLLLLGTLLTSLVAGNMLKRRIPFLKESLIPTSVIGGILLLILAGIYRAFAHDSIFDSSIFGGKGTATLEILTYHTLALGFIASTLKSSESKLTKQRGVEIFNTGVTTVSTYLLQAIFGFGITMIAALMLTNFFPAAGVLLPFGYGQGTGQALNYGNIYETEYGFVGGKSFGLAVAALGFLSAALGGVLHLNIMKKKGKIKVGKQSDEPLKSEEIENKNEIPMQESIDKMTFQFAWVAVAYIITYLIMLGLGKLLPNMKSLIYGFNFLIGVLSATLLKGILKFCRKTSLIKRDYTNNFLLTRVSNFFFDIMVVAGIAAIRLETLAKYWGILLVLGVVGLIITYIYNYIVAKTLFPAYPQEQFLMMYGMLTGTASTGIILLREIDGEFKTPAADNMVYQNFPAIVFGFPMMFLATLAPEKRTLTMIIFVVFFAAMNIILFRSKIFKKRKK